MSLNTTPITWVAGTALTAAQMNAELRDAITGIQAAWTGYTPVLTATSVNPTLGNGTIAGRFTRVGKTVTFFIQTVIGSTTTVGTGSYIWTLPVASLQGIHQVTSGSGNFFDTSAGSDFGGWGVVQTSSTAVGLRSSTATAVGAAVPVVPATGDIITIMATYEAA